LETRLQPNDLLGLSGSLLWGTSLLNFYGASSAAPVASQVSQASSVAPSGDFMVDVPAVAPRSVSSSQHATAQVSISQSTVADPAAAQTANAAPGDPSFSLDSPGAAMQHHLTVDAPTPQAQSVRGDFGVGFGLQGSQVVGGQAGVYALSESSQPGQASAALSLMLAAAAQHNGGSPAGPGPASLGQAPDATQWGPLATASAEYRFAAAFDPEVSPDTRFTEDWARMYRPRDLTSGPYPLIIFLHGNHFTCGFYPNGIPPRNDNNGQYTTMGTCPANYVITPNHMGYEYLADKLASWGYIVFSVNANRGITAGGGVAGDLGLNLARGRLVLKQLERISTWNRVAGTTPTSLGIGTSGLLGQIDFSSVGLFGHSRGGEGMRAAYNLYRDAGSPWPGRIVTPVTFQGIYEMAPVDGQTSRVLNADNTAWNVTLPMCDGDVSDLQGVKPFDRMMLIDEANATPKSSYTVWGANHNFFNTEWQLTDSSGCTGTGNTPLFQTSGDIGSATQRRAAEASVLAFFRANVGPNADPTFEENFNPQYDLPDVVASVTRVDRGYTDSPSSSTTTRFEDFDQPTGTNTYGFPNNTANLSQYIHGGVPNHAPTQRAALLSWTTGGSGTYFQTNWTAAGTGSDISGYGTLDLRLSRQSSGLNPADATNFSIQLVHDDGTLSDPVQLQNYADLLGPVGGPGGLHPILQTARIQLGDFTNVDLTRIHGVRLTFDGTNSGAIYVANIRLSVYGGAYAGNGGHAVPGDPGTTLTASPVEDHAVNTIRAIRAVPNSTYLLGQPGYEVEVTSSREFPARDELAIMRIGKQQIALSRYPDSGDSHTLIFTLTTEQYAQTASGDHVMVQYGQQGLGERWDFGQLDKGLLSK
jgi:hypothetical protein